MYHIVCQAYLRISQELWQMSIFNVSFSRGSKLQNMIAKIKMFGLILTLTSISYAHIIFKVIYGPYNIDYII